jgi:hypothetical protein
MAEHDAEHGIGLWLVEARAVRIAGSPWAPLFTAVVSPNEFTATVEQDKKSGGARNLAELLDACETSQIRDAVRAIADGWSRAGHALWFYGYASLAALAARGPARNGQRSVLTLYSDGRVMVPFGAYSGQNTGIPIPSLATDEFRVRANELFGFTTASTQPRTAPGWLSPDRVEAVLAFANEVAHAYQEVLLTVGSEVSMPPSGG